MKNWKNWIIATLVLAVAVLACLTQCKRTEVKEVVVYKKGLPHVIHTITKDTMWKEKSVYLRGKSIIKIERDTSKKIVTARDTVKLNGYTIAVYDTLRNDTLKRNLTLVAIDSTEVITIHDSTLVTRTDTVFKNTTTEGGYWKGFRHGAAIGVPVGYAAGLGTVLIAK